MMTYRVTLELRSALGTPLAADTLWGHIAWGIRYRQGEAALLNWLNRYDQPEPPLVISDPLPAGFFPRPQIPPPVMPDEHPTKEQAAKMKRLAKIPWIGWDTWRTVAARLSPESLFSALEAWTSTVQESDKGPRVFSMAVTRAGINRLTQSTMQPGGAALFTQENFYYEKARFEVWVISPENATTIEQWFRDGLVGGYGRDASAGLGWLEVLNVEQVDLPNVLNANAGVLLAPSVPRTTDPARGFFRLGVRSGRVGGDFAFWEPTVLQAETWQRQKRPVFCLLSGSVLFWDGQPPLFVGRTVSGVHPQLPTIRHYGMSPVLPCRLDDSFRQHRFLQERAQPISGPITSEVSP